MQGWYGTILFLENEVVHRLWHEVPMGAGRRTETVNQTSEVGESDG